MKATIAPSFPRKPYSSTLFRYSFRISGFR